MNDKISLLNIEKLFDNIKYIIPIYQRNYAWGKEQIEQLIIDVIDSSSSERGNAEYYLGNLIVKRISKDEYEVVDGQQRLTTLYLLITYLNQNSSSKITLDKNALSFEARKKADDTLLYLNEYGLNEKDNFSFYSEEILDGYKHIKRFFESEANKEKTDTVIHNLQKRIRLLRVLVPEGIDMNHYFEIMNTRGEQLEQHEIAKGKFLEIISGKAENKTAALIWDACSDMSSYVQMNFKKDYRDKIFGENWDAFDYNSDDNAFDKIVDIICNIDKTENNKITKENNEKNEEIIEGDLEYIIQNNLGKKIAERNRSEKDSEDEQERFESVISFPNFLLQVNAVLTGKEEKDNSLDDKNLLKSLKEHFSDINKAKNFIFNLLKFRFLFDKYIIKREYTKDYKEEGKWSLQNLQKMKKSEYPNGSKEYDKPVYKATFTESEDGKTGENAKIRMLQSCLRITYTSPKVMHWISEALKFVSENNEGKLLDCLQDYCREKVKNSGYQDKKGFDLERIVFTYLDYLLYWNYKDYTFSGKEKFICNKSWQFQFRNSIEHFYPQHSDIEYWKDEAKEKLLNDFGNLALITVKGNSKFSNLHPVAKKRKEDIIEQSLKLKIMAAIMENDEWTPKMTDEHGNEMLKILEDDINKKIAQ